MTFNVKSPTTILIVVLFLCSNLILAQTVTSTADYQFSMKGKITDKKSKKALVNTDITVFANHLSWSVKTDNSGMYEIKFYKGGEKDLSYNDRKSEMIIFQFTTPDGVIRKTKINRNKIKVNGTSQNAPPNVNKDIKI